MPRCMWAPPDASGQWELNLPQCREAKKKDFVFYDEKGGKVCYVSKKRMEFEYQERVKKKNQIRLKHSQMKQWRLLKR